jgi:hypothetical protein
LRVLYFSSPEQDYLADSLLHGLRVLLGPDLVDVPQRDVMYRGRPRPAKLYGNGFTLYGGLLEDLEIDRSDIAARLRAGEFDLVVFSDIWRQWKDFARWRPLLNPRSTVVLDGVDSPQVYPYAGLWWRRPERWLAPPAHRSFRYFKREWTSDSQFSLWHRLVPARARSLIPQPRNLLRISFSIPEEKITTVKPAKTKEFPVHIVDPELRGRLPNGQSSYAFSDESGYYRDLQSSRFGITTKRSGWDCMRHYEIAANGAVPCFRDLDRKPESCAPHGLDRSNCISYRDANDLFRQVAALTPAAYDELQDNAMQWVRANTTKVRATQFLRDVRNDS